MSHWVEQPISRLQSLYGETAQLPASGHGVLNHCALSTWDQYGRILAWDPGTGRK
jgi:hypothetical protein